MLCFLHASKSILSRPTPSLPIHSNSVEFFKTGDPNSLASKITRLLDDEDARKKLVNNGLEHIKKFSRKNFIKGFEEFILNE